MPVQERERLQFYTDLNDPKSVYGFPDEFVRFLKEHSRDFEAQQFLSMVIKYMEQTPTEDWSLETICSIAHMYADIYDVSGIPFSENPFLGREEEPRRESNNASEAEGVLTELDEDAPRPQDVWPEFPEIVLEVAEGDTLEALIYHSIVELKRARRRKAADQLAREIRQIAQENGTPLQILRIIMSYITVEVALSGD